MFSLADAEQVVSSLQAADVRASLDPARLPLPGVWVQVAGFQVDTLGTFTTELRLQLVTKDTDHRRAMDSLLELCDQVAAVFPVRSARARTVLMPDGNRLPGLEVPVTGRSPLT